MGAFLDGASNKFKITRQKGSKALSEIRHTKTLIGHLDSVVDVACCPETGLVSSSSFDGTCRLWSFETDACLSVYNGHSGTVNSSRFCPTDPSIICSASGDGALHVWSCRSAVEANSKLRLETCPRTKNTCGDDETPPLVPDPDMLAEKTLQSRATICELKHHEAPASAVDWLFDGKTLVSSSWDRTLVIWDLEKTLPAGVLTGHEEEVLYVRCHPSQGMFLSTSADSTFRLWDMRTTKKPSVSVCNAHNSDVTSAAFYASVVISGSLDKYTKIWDMKNLREPLFSFKVSSGIMRMSIDSQGYLCMPLVNGQFKVVEMAARSSSSCLSQRGGHSKSAAASCWMENPSCHNFKNLYTCSIDSSIVRWAVSCGIVPKKAMPHGQ